MPDGYPLAGTHIHVETNRLLCLTSPLSIAEIAHGLVDHYQQVLDVSVVLQGVKLLHSVHHGEKAPRCKVPKKLGITGRHTVRARKMRVGLGN